MSTDVTFSRDPQNITTLYGGSQNNNFYVYIAAKSNTNTFDFGLMCNLQDELRNEGMHAFYKNESGAVVAETWAKVPGSISDAGVMTICTAATVELKMDVHNGEVELYMEKDGECIYYNPSVTASSMVSGTSTPLTFVQAMTCVRPSNTQNTSITSGAYINNVRFSNCTLYRGSDHGTTTPFPCYGDNTYFVLIVEPSKLPYSNNVSSNYEDVSISYN